MGHNQMVMYFLVGKECQILILYCKFQVCQHLIQILLAFWVSRIWPIHTQKDLGNDELL